uniref:Uncharacterized protein n=1 Tax=Cyprinus carpio TaxID=7962 RepID=A0A8C1UAX3_CYPCA
MTKRLSTKQYNLIHSHYIHLGLSHTPLNMNHYANKKSALESMLDMALLMANASQLKAVLEQGPKFTLYSSLNMLLHQTNIISTTFLTELQVIVLFLFLLFEPLLSVTAQWNIYR